MMRQAGPVRHLGQRGHEAGSEHAQNSCCYRRLFIDLRLRIRPNDPYESFRLLNHLDHPLLFFNKSQQPVRFDQPDKSLLRGEVASESLF